MSEPVAGQGEIKVKAVTQGSAWKAYKTVMFGGVSFWRALWTEFLTSVLGGWPGALGLFLRMKLYPTLFKRCGRKVGRSNGRGSCSIP